MAEDKFALVTGGGRGIGRAAALALARAGWHVALAGRNAEPLAETARAIEAPGSARARAVLATSPIRRRSRLCSPRSSAPSAGSIFCSTTPASARRRSPIEELTYDQWKAVVDVNLTGVFLCAQGAVALMKRQRPQGGRIINNGSVSAQTPRPEARPIPRPSTPSGPDQVARARRARFRHRLRPDRHRQRRDRDDRRDDRRRAPGRRKHRGRAALRRRRGRRGDRPYGEPAAVVERAVDDADGDQDAVRRAGRDDFFRPRGGKVADDSPSEDGVLPTQWSAG